MLTVANITFLKFILLFQFLLFQLLFFGWIFMSETDLESVPQLTWVFFQTLVRLKAVNLSHKELHLKWRGVLDAVIS